MASQLVNGFCCIKHYWGVYEQKSKVNSIRVDDWTAELAIIASNISAYICDFCINLTCAYQVAILGDALCLWAR